MVGQTGRERWGALHPMMAEITHGQLQAQAVMEVAEVIEAAHQIHTGDQGIGTPG
jgi:hypothetical protein